MAGKRNIYRIGINVTIFIVLEIVALNMLSRSSKGAFFLDKLSHSFMSTVWGISQDIGDYFALKSINRNLADENFTLREALARAGVEVDSLKTLDGDTFRSGNFLYTKADIIKISRGKHHNYLIINKGSRHGVTSHTGIITSKGIVGIIDTVGTDYSFAVSFQNSNFNLSARIGREGAVGPMAWDGKSNDKAILREISLQNRFRVGDTVYTSGLSSVFPADIPLGTIEGSKVINGSTYDLSVRLFQNFKALRYVTLVSNTDRVQIESLEKKEVAR